MEPKTHTNRHQCVRGHIISARLVTFDSAKVVLVNEGKLIGSVSVRQTVHIEQGTRSHRNQQAVHIDAGLPFTSTRVNEMGDQPVNIENETAHSKF